MPDDWSLTVVACLFPSVSAQTSVFRSLLYYLFFYFLVPLSWTAWKSPHERSQLNEHITFWSASRPCTENASMSVRETSSIFRLAAIWIRCSRRNDGCKAAIAVAIYHCDLEPCSRRRNESNDTGHRWARLTTTLSQIKISFNWLSMPFRRK